MFYVSNISGSLTPFDPSLTPIASTPQVSATVSDVADVGAAGSMTFSEVIDGTSLGNIPNVLKESAAIYEGSVAPTTTNLTGNANALNIARAGAAMAYRIQNTELSSTDVSQDSNGLISPIQQLKKHEYEDKNVSSRVEPIKRSKSRYQPLTKERKQVLVAQDIMSAPVFSMYENASLLEVVKAFKEHRYRHIPIINSDRKLTGILSDRDFVDSVTDDILIKTAVRHKMKINILTARPETPITKIAEVMITNHVGCLPIIDETGMLVGMLTRTDILNAIVRHAPLEMWG